MVNTSERKNSGGHWTTAWVEYSRNSTIQGLDKLTDPSPFSVRKYIWFAIITGCLVTLTIQTTYSIMYFLERPASVNIKINHNRTVLFPAVTICNQNAFRTTRAASLGWYDMLSELFDGEEYNLSTDLQKYQAENVSVSDLYLQTGHNITDLMLSCEWMGQKCGPEDFTESVTDHGLCYTFNGLRGNGTSEVKSTNKTGSRGGLRLRLNIEQYEYMPGPNSGAGVKVQVHHQQDVPQIRDLGMSVPPGSHSRLGVTTVQLYDLEEPYGTCVRGIQPKFFQFYTVATCNIEHLERKMVHRCGCKDNYMPDMMPGYPPVCNLTTYLGCVVPSIDGDETMSDMNDMVTCSHGNACDCPVPCERTMFSSSVSYGTLSNFDTENFLRSGNQEIQNRFMVARETQQRVNKAIVYTDKITVHRLQNLSESLNNTFNDVQHFMSKMEASLSKSMEELAKRIHFHWDRGITAVRYNIEHDFLRSWQVMEERAVNHVTTGFFEIVHAINDTLLMLNRTDLQYGEREVLYALSDQNLAARQAQAERALANITLTHQYYLDGISIVPFRQTWNRRYDKTYIPTELLRHNLPEHMRRFNALNQSTREVIQNLTNLRQSLLTAFLNPDNFSVAQDLFTETAAKYIKTCKQYNYRRFMYKERILMKPLELINNRIETFEKLNESLFEKFDVLKNVLNKINGDIDEARLGAWAVLQYNVHQAHNYLHDQSYKKTELAHIMASASTDESLKKITLFFTALRSRDWELQDALIDLEEKTRAVWENMLTESTTEKFYAMVANDTDDMVYNASNRDFYLTIFAHLLRVPVSNVTDVPAQDFYRILNADFRNTTSQEKEEELKLRFGVLRQKTDIAGGLDQKDQQFLESIKTYIEEMKNYERGNELNFEFIRNNFLNLDIYMKELSYEEIRQTVAYSGNNLLSDLGGNLGLWIGATFITVAELLDFFLHTLLKARLRHCTGPCRSAVSASESV